MRKIILLTAFLSLSGIFFAQEVWKITSLEWPPYSGANLENQGTAIHELRQLLEKEGIQLQVEFYPWTRAQALANTKDYVGYFPAWPVEVYEGFTASEPVSYSRLGFIALAKRKIEFSSVLQLFRNYKIGLISTYTYPPIISNAAVQYPQNIDKSPDETALVKKITKGRFDIGVTDPNVALYVAKEQGITGIKVIKDLSRESLVLAFRNGKDNQKRMETLNKLIPDE
jgi:polar amino acid transport system substrate-binding protein